MKIVFLEPLGLSVERIEKECNILKSLGHEVIIYSDRCPDKNIERAADADIVIESNMPLRKDFFDACPNLKMLSIAFTGLDHIDLKECEKMKVTGIVAEYNPFHTGHRYQIDFLKDNGFDTVVVAMSGSCVQRGTPAIINKQIAEGILNFNNSSFEVFKVFTLTTKGALFNVTSKIFLVVSKSYCLDNILIIKIGVEYLMLKYS